MTFARILALLVSLPVLALVACLFVPVPDLWPHLIETTLGGYFYNSLILVVCVAAGAIVIGTSCAWLCVFCDFPGRRLFEWAVILPLAFPPYIVAYTYTGMLDYGGSVHTWLHDVIGVQPPAIRSMSGGIAVLVFVLYPYVYLLVRVVLLQQSQKLLEAARVLGAGTLPGFTRLTLSLARPAMVAGTAIVAMETLSDYAAMQYFGIHTFSVGIFRTWFGLDSMVGAAQLSVILLVFTMSLIALEKRARSRARHYGESHRTAHAAVFRMRGAGAAAAVTVCAVPMTLGFVIPAAQLAIWGLTTATETFNDGYPALLGNTLLLGTGTALAVCAIALVFAYGQRLYPSDRLRWLQKIATSGYAVPGTVITVGVMLVCTTIERIAGAALAGLVPSGLFLSGTLFILYFAYTSRFMTLGFSAVETSLNNVSRNIDFAAATLKTRRTELFGRIHLPLIRPGLLTAMLIVFVEVIKELPATLVLRPFDFNTLAVRTYELASTERLPDIALPSLSIVAVGLLPLIIAARRVTGQRRTSA